MARPGQRTLGIAVKELGDSIQALGQYYAAYAPGILKEITRAAEAQKQDEGKAEYKATDYQDEERELNPLEQLDAIATLQLMRIGHKLNELIIHFDDCHAHLKKESPLTAYRMTLKRYQFCVWCEHIGKKNLATGSWSEGDDAVHFCEWHMEQFQKGTGPTTQEMMKVWNHEAIHAWQAAGFPDPKAFFDQWKREHPG